MTSQTLMSNNPLTHPKSETLSPDQLSTAADPVQLNKLPYQTNHKVELLHLQAETEALLQQLKTLKQQRLGEDQSILQPSNIPVLVAR